MASPIMIADDDSSVVWASRILVSAAVVYFYDFLLTFPSELEMYEHMTRKRVLLMFLPLRYIPLVYQLVMVLAVIDNTWTNSSCSKWDNAAQALDTLFQITYILIISWRVYVVVSRLIAIPIVILGLISPVVNVAVSNPSNYAQCRLLNTSPTAMIVTLVPCLRSAFDAAATLVLLYKLWTHAREIEKALGSDHSSRFYNTLITEEMKDIILIFIIMAMEAVFVQIPSVSPIASPSMFSHVTVYKARTHARNFIVPFVDSLTATLATRFLMELSEKHSESTQAQISTIKFSPRAVIPESDIAMDDIGESAETFHY